MWGAISSSHPTQGSLWVFTTNRYPSTKLRRAGPGSWGRSLALVGVFWGSWSLPAEVRICLASFIPASSLSPNLFSLPMYIVTGLGGLCQSSGFSRDSSSFGWASFWRAPLPVGCILTIPHPKRLSAVPMDRISGMRRDVPKRVRAARPSKSLGTTLQQW